MCHKLPSQAKPSPAKLFLLMNNKPKGHLQMLERVLLSSTKELSYSSE